MSSKRHKSILALSIVLSLLSACGGGGGSGASPVNPTTGISAYESMALAANGGDDMLNFYLPYLGLPVSGTHYLDKAHFSLPASPSVGVQTMATTTQQLGSSLAVEAVTATRYLVNGQIYASLNTTPSFAVSYVGGNVRLQKLASDGVTVLEGFTDSGHVLYALSGTLANSPNAIQHGFFSFATNVNTALIDTTKTWNAGATFMTFTRAQTGDSYQVLDCSASSTTLTATPIACATGVSGTLAARFPLTPPGDVTYQFADGQMVSTGGVNVWVANAKRQITSSVVSDQYRIYFILNGNLYTGVLLKDGTFLNKNSYLTAGSSVQTTDSTRIAFNSAAIASLAAALRF